MHTVTDRGNSTPKLIQVTGVGSIPTSGSGLELYSNYSNAVVQAYDRNTNLGIPLLLNPVNADIYMVESGGNVGIGTRNAAGKLSFPDLTIGIDPIGITWYSNTGDPTLYGIHRTAGQWTAPDYQQIRMRWDTGIVLDPGASFSKSYVDIRGNGLMVTEGNLGIGTTSPAYKLEVNGMSGFSGILNANKTGENIRLKANGTNTLDGGLFMEGDGTIYLTEWNNTRGLVIKPDGNSFFKGGNVGIGTANPQSKLAVNGIITTTKIKVTQDGWSDYVFDSSYQLSSLNQVEQYILKHKHLPDVPSAVKVKKEGLDLGDNQAVLLRKIEELTLYIIEQNKKIDKQQQRNTTLEKRLAEIEEKISGRR